MKIAYIIPYFYNWNSFPTTRCAKETLEILGHKVTLFSKKNTPKIDYNQYNQIWLVGAGTKLTEEEFVNVKPPVIAFGLSDPNLYSEEHMRNCDLYCTNDFRVYEELENTKLTFFNPTSCDKRYHRNLALPKITDILVFGVGKHKFIPNRNETVNKLRSKRFKITVFGRNWDIHKDTYGFIEGEKLIEEINKAKVLLDLTNEETAVSHRLFEGAGCATPVITLFRKDVAKLFIPKKEIIMYKDFKELIKFLNYFLKNLNAAKQVGKNAQRRAYQSHDISIRIKRLLKFIKEVKL
jgi:glycosyltransferase involved in cell wall biosynthesis